jgi:hypothetical protein
MKWSLKYTLIGLLFLIMSVFAFVNIEFSTMTTKITQGPFKMILMGMVLMGLATFMRRKTIR